MIDIKKNFTQLTAALATTTTLSIAIAFEASKAEAASYSIFWEGLNGYTATGMFSFDDSLLGGIVTQDELSDLTISFFDPAGSLLQEFDYDFPNPDNSGEFTFRFDSVTKIITQDQNFNFDLGIDFTSGELGIDFFVALDPEFGVPEPTIFLDENLVPQGCLADFVDDVLPDCNQFDTGGVLVATKVPEPGSFLGLLTLGALGTGSMLQKKPNR